MSKKNHTALLYSFKVSINIDGELVVDWEGPPSPQDIENAFDSWNEDYEHTKKIASLCSHLRDYSSFQYEEIKKMLAAY